MKAKPGPQLKVDSIELAPNFTVGEYKAAVDAMDREAIVAFLRSRFRHRYLGPAMASKSGFAIMAIGCLTVEAAESLIRGWPSSDGRSELSFFSFFDRAEAFVDLRGHVQGFYRHVRCGILHQAETTGGWRVLRRGQRLFDSNTLVINADLFLEVLGAVLEEHFAELHEADWNSFRWKSTRRKLDSIIRNCSPAG